jgi:2-oxo-4-hydroxy-4-carboxy-5-ureidoimidazoline decarboxylase
MLAQPQLLPIAALNQVPRAEFTAALKPLFEAAAPLADALYDRRPFASYDDLIRRAEATASLLSLPQQIEVVNAHPRIGERPDRLSTLSYREQGYDRDHADEPQDVYTALSELNRAYEERFGFRFLVFVNKRAKSAIVAVLRDRLNNARDEELQTALRDMFLIARDRLSALFPLGEGGG